MIRETLESGKIPLQDRSLFTCIAFDFAIKAMGGFNIWHESEMLFLSQGFLLPNIILFLDVSDENIQKRIGKEKNQILPVLIEPNFNLAFKNYFLNSVTELVRLKTIDANQNLNQVLLQAIRQIEAVI
jgi:thymidylate kinase